ncbi:hypothetical protein J6590_012421 [Homalodisca vitripennis]|nr:hypothetical protein J6590_012421 [Homalodisca vitripennis]
MSIGKRRCAGREARSDQTTGDNGRRKSESRRVRVPARGAGTTLYGNGTRNPPSSAQNPTIPIQHITRTPLLLLPVSRGIVAAASVPMLIAGETMPNGAASCSATYHSCLTISEIAHPVRAFYYYSCFFYLFRVSLRKIHRKTLQSL